MSIYDIKIRRGMKFRLVSDNPDTRAKAGDTVKVTSVTAMGIPSDGTHNDYEKLRVGNGQYTWRVCREELAAL